MSPNGREIDVEIDWHDGLDARPGPNRFVVRVMAGSQEIAQRIWTESRPDVHTFTINLNPAKMKALRQARNAGVALVAVTQQSDTHKDTDKLFERNYVTIVDIPAPNRPMVRAGTLDCSNVMIQPGADLSNCNLSGADLSNANLTGADLSGAILTDANLPGANLPGANLTGAILSGANLTGASLSGASLSGANLPYADLAGAFLPYANLSGATLTGATLTGATLTGATLTGASLSGANLSGANLSYANLSSANLSGANLSSAILSGANLTGAICPSGAMASGDPATC
jgi:hypothetical protein